MSIDQCKIELDSLNKKEQDLTVLIKDLKAQIKEKLIYVESARLIEDMFKVDAEKIENRQFDNRQFFEYQKSKFNEYRQANYQRFLEVRELINRLYFLKISLWTTFGNKTRVTLILKKKELKKENKKQWKYLFAKYFLTLDDFAFFPWKKHLLIKIKTRLRGWKNIYICLAKTKICRLGNAKAEIEQEGAIYKAENLEMDLQMKQISINDVWMTAFEKKQAQQTKVFKKLQKKYGQ